MIAPPLSYLQMVLAQRLVRLICESCTEPYKLLPGEHEWMSLEIGAEKVDSHKYIKGKGCSHCNGTGYLGRTGVYEMLEMTKAVVEAAPPGNTTVFRRLILMPAARRQIISVV